MQFCNECGAILNLFEFPERELCPTCFGQYAALTRTSPSPCMCTSLPQDTRIICENDTIRITSQEGWTLWNGSITDAHPLACILQKAGQIYAIRQKRFQNK